MPTYFVKTTLVRRGFRLCGPARRRPPLLKPVELGLHNPVGAAIGPSGDSEMALAQRLLTQFSPKSLWICGRYYGVPVLIMAVDELHPQGDREFLLRVRGNLKARVAEVHSDGSVPVPVSFDSPSAAGPGC